MATCLTRNISATTQVWDRAVVSMDHSCRKPYAASPRSRDGARCWLCDSASDGLLVVRHV